MNGERRPAGRGTALTAFTARGTVLAETLAAALDGHLRTEDEPLANWARRSFESCEALVFVGAAGIAVRTVAPLIRNKTEDPAVVRSPSDRLHRRFVGTLDPDLQLNQSRAKR